MTLFCALAWILVGSDTVTLNLEALNLQLRDFAYFDEFGSNLKFIGKFAVDFVKFIR